MRGQKDARRSGQVQVERRGRTTDAVEGSVGVRISRTVHSDITDDVAKSSGSRHYWVGTRSASNWMRARELEAVAWMNEAVAIEQKPRSISAGP